MNDEIIENVIPENELPVYDELATDMTFGDEVVEEVSTSEQGDVVEGEAVVIPEAPTTHGVEEAVAGSLEEE